jgi:hypothetical protein
MIIGLVVLLPADLSNYNPKSRKYMSNHQLVIWDFDGVICDSLYECITVTKVAVHMLTRPYEPVNASNLHQLCPPSEVQDTYLVMRPLRPFIVKGQDYLWQYFYSSLFDPVPPDFDKYKNLFDSVFDEDRDKLYETAFYSARKLVQNLMAKQYFTLFKAYPGALYAFRTSVVRKNTYICTARDQQGVLLLFGNNGITFPKERIYSKDCNGCEENKGMGKSEQILTILGNEQDFILIEDQVKAPAELLAVCPHMKVVYAAYGYGLKQDWEAAGVPLLATASTPEQLLYSIY